MTEQSPGFGISRLFTLDHWKAEHSGHQAAGYFKMTVNLRVSVPTLPVKAELLCRKDKSQFIVPEEKKTYTSMCDSKMCWGLFVRGPL